MRMPCSLPPPSHIWHPLLLRGRQHHPQRTHPIGRDLLLDQQHRHPRMGKCGQRGLLRWFYPIYKFSL